MTYCRGIPPGGGTPTAINPTEEGAVMKNEKTEAEQSNFLQEVECWSGGAHSFILKTKHTELPWKWTKLLTNAAHSR